MLQVIAYDDATHKKTSDEIAKYKTLICKCKKKVRLSAQRLINSKKHFIVKKIDNKNLQTKFNDVQTQLANVQMQRKDNIDTLIVTKYKQFQQQVENMQSQLDNACMY